MTPSPSSSSPSSSSSSSPSPSSSITTPIEDLEWEEWDPHTSPLSFYHHCLAGSFAGVAEHTLLYPLDTVKTCWQSRVLHRAGGGSGGGSPNSLCPPCSFHPNNSIPSAAKSEEGIWSTMKHLMHHHPHHPSTSATTTATTAASTTGRNPASFQHHPHHGRSHPSHQRGVYTLARPSVEASSSTWKVSNAIPTNGAIATEELRKKQKRPWSHRARSAASASALSFEGAASATSATSSLSSSASSTPSAAGVKRLWRGVQTMFIGCVPAHALYFSSYELVKKLSNRSNGHHDFDSNSTSTSNSHHDSNSTSHSAYENTLAPAQAMLAGGLATLLHDSIMTPMDTIKQRMQLGHYRNVRHALSSIVVGGGGEGWRGLYRSFPVTVATNVPYGMIVVTVNERLRGALEEGLYGGSDTEPRNDDDNPDRPFHFLTVLLSGMGAGTVAAAATAPLDRVKTRLQTQRMGLVVAGVAKDGPPDGVKAIAEERALAASRGEVKACPKMVAREVKEALFASSGWSSNSSTVTSNNITNITHNQNHHHHHPPNHNPFHKTYYTTPREAFRSIVQEEGYRGLFRGTLPRVALHAPSVAISWTAYEMAKGWLLCFGGSTE